MAENFSFNLSIPRPNMLRSNRLFLNVRAAVLEELSTVCLHLTKEKNDFTLAQVTELENAVAMLTSILQETRAHSYETFEAGQGALHYTTEEE